MKTKLLKKIRKDFIIKHYPHGYCMGDKCFNANMFVLFDETNSYNIFFSVLNENPDNNYTFTSEIECINYLKSKIIDITRCRYYEYSKKRRSRKVWYNG